MTDKLPLGKAIVLYQNSRNWLCRRSTATIALLVQAIFLTVQYPVEYINWNYASSVFSFSMFGVALFIPGAIKRWDKKNLLGMAVLGGLVPFLVNWVLSFLDVPYSPLLWEFPWPALLVIFVCAGQWLFDPDDSWQRLGWMFLCGLVGAGAFSIFRFLVEWTTVPEFFLLYGARFLQAWLVWISVDIGRKVATMRSFGARRSVVITAIAVAVCYLLVFQYGIYALAKHSLRDGFPITRSRAVILLSTRKNHDDFVYIADSLERADWTEPFSYPNNIHTNGDWRNTAVSLMIAHDEKWAAERLTQLLRDHPSEQLIDMTDGFFIEQKCYETVPIYWRYALKDSLEPTIYTYVGANRHKHALEKLRIPDVVDAWLLDSLYSQTLFHTISAQKNGVPFDLPDDELVFDSDGLRSRMKEFTEIDPGPSWIQWNELYHEKKDSLPTPLPETIIQEVARIRVSVGRYEEAVRTLSDLDEEPDFPDPNWNVATTKSFEDEINAYCEHVDKLVFFLQKRRD